MSQKPLIHFVHEGKAAYPEVAALRSYFGARGFDTAQGSPSDVLPTDRPSASWHMMGFYPRRLPADVTIHDYRSLSVGRFSRVKDRVKRLLNSKPDLRFFQNQEIREALGFPEHSSTYYLPMGVPRFFIANRSLKATLSTDFVYIGSMLGERRCELMLDSFVKRFGDGKRFDLYGTPNSDLVERYRDRSNIRFPGAVPQEHLPEILKSARVGVCYFPMHYPHLLQAPTKLMEYAALGMRVLANDHPQSRIGVSKFGLNCKWGANEDMFADVPDVLDWADNSSIDPEPMSWESVITESGVEAAVRQALKLD